MELQWIGGPFLAAGLSALALGSVAFGRGEPLPRLRQGPLVLIAVSGAFLLLTAIQRLGADPAVLSSTSLAHLTGLAMLVAAAELSVRANRVRRRAEGLTSGAPVSIEEAIARARQSGERTGPLLLEGRIRASDPVISPGGVVCAFYDAALREIRGDGEAGPLLRSERAAVQILWLEGERAQLAVPLGAAGFDGAHEIRRCQWSEGRREATGNTGVPAPIEAPVEALSFERVGRLGERCLVLGEVARGPAAGSWVVEGVDGGPPLICVGGGPQLPARRLSRMAALRIAGAAGACIVAAFLFGTFR